MYGKKTAYYASTNRLHPLYPTCHFGLLHGDYANGGEK
jgi:hypothetical protein